MRIAQQTTACDAYHAHRGAGFAASQRERIKAFIVHFAAAIGLSENWQPH